MKTLIITEGYKRPPRKMNVLDEYAENGVFIHARRGRTQGQETGLQIINKLLQDTKMEEDRESVFAYVGIATGYANAMKTYGFMDEKELRGIIGIIEQTGEKAIDRIEKSKSPLFLFRTFSEKVKA